MGDGCPAILVPPRPEPENMPSKRPSDPWNKFVAAFYNPAPFADDSALFAILWGTEKNLVAVEGILRSGEKALPALLFKEGNLSLPLLEERYAALEIENKKLGVKEAPEDVRAEALSLQQATLELYSRLREALKLLIHEAHERALEAQEEDGLTPPNLFQVLTDVAGAKDADALLQHLLHCSDTDEMEHETAEPLLRQLLETRFRIRLDSEMSAEAMYKVYKIFQKLPESHVRDNPLFSQLILSHDHPVAILGGWYDQTHEEVVVVTPEDFDLSAKPSQRTWHYLDDEQTEDAKKLYKIDEVNLFEHTTLHEIGHAVDAKLNYMKGLTDGTAAPDTHGGWAIFRRSGLAKHLTLRAFNGTSFMDDHGASFPSAGRAATLEAMFAEILKGKSFVQASEALRDAQQFSLSFPTGSVLGQLVDAAQVDKLVTDSGEVRGALTAVTLEQLAAQAVTQARELVRQAYSAKEASILIFVLDSGVRRYLGDANLTMEQALSAAADARGAVDAWKDLTPDWSAMSKHPAVVAAENIRYNGTDLSAWKEGSAGATKRKIGDRVFQHWDSEFWTSYLIDARKLGVSNYQFAHYSEWFAELYALHHGQHLSYSHPGRKIIEAATQGMT